MDVQLLRQEISGHPAGLKLSENLYEEAYSRGVTLTQFLEEIDPTDEYPESSPMRALDAFERQLYCSGIRTHGAPSRGIWPDKVDKFVVSEREGTKALLPEFINRVWRSVSSADYEVTIPLGRDPFMMDAKRFYLSSSPVSDVLHPDYISALVRQKKIAPAIPLATIVALTTPIDSGVYKAFYLTDDAAEYTMERVAESTEVPTATLTGGDHSIAIRKYGRRLVGSYETFRRMRIDRFAMHIALLAVKAEVDKVKTAIDVLINGDGNSGTSATNHDLTDIDGDAAAGTPTLKGYLGWRMKWTSPYYCDVVLGKEAHILELLTCNLGTANVTFGQFAGLFGIGGVTPIGPQLGPASVGWEDQVSSEKWLGLDSRFALEMVTEIGASLTETNKIIRDQTNEIVMTESLGFCILDANANKTLSLDA